MNQQDHIRRALSVLFQENDVVELRALNVPTRGGWTSTFSGYFSDLDELAEHAIVLDSQRAHGTYVTLNPVQPDLLARRQNRVARCGKQDSLTKNDEIVRRRWLPLDFDPCRPPGISATDEEKRIARERAEAVTAFLEEHGFSKPILADSGNGIHLLYAIDLPSKDGNLVRRVLETLSERFSDDVVQVDRTVHNAARIWKLYGTTARKGDPIQDRPHRQARLLCVPEKMEPVPIVLLQRLAPEHELPAHVEHPSSWNEEQIADALNHIPPRPPYEKWVRLIAAVFDATGYDAYAAERLLKAWSPEEKEGEYLRKLRNGLDHVTAGTLHFEASQHGWSPKTKSLNTSRNGLNDETSNGTDDRASIATRLVNLVKDRCELFHSERSMRFAQRRSDGVCFLLGSESFEQWVSGCFFEAEERVLPSAALKDAVTTLKGQAMKRHADVHTRTSGSISNSVVCIAVSRTSIARVTPKGIDVLPAKNAEARFWLPDAAEDLPEPDLTGSLKDIGQALDLDGDPLLIAAGWMLTALLPGGPYPVLAIFGPQGSGKSTRCRHIVRSLDPSKLLLRTAPKSEDNLIVAARSSHVLAFDNLSTVSGWLSDSLCRVATGAGIAKRKLYSDLDPVVISVKRPIVINAIVDVVRRSDLADRLMLLELPRLSERQTERQVQERYKRLQPKVLGALLKGVSAALRDFSSIELPELPRMADACLWAEAGLRGLGAEPLAFYNAYTKAGQDANRSIVEGDLVGSLVVTIAEQGGFTGTASQLLAQMQKMATGQRRSLPPDATRLSSELRRLDPAIRNALGWGITFERESGTGRRLIIIPGASASLASSASHSAPLPSNSDASDASDAGDPPIFSADGSGPAPADPWDMEDGDDLEVRP